MNEQILSVKEKYTQELMDKHGLTGMGIGYKQVGEEMTDRVSIVFMVEKKLPIEEIAGDQLLPSDLEGFETDVVETGPIKALTLTAKVRPAVPGYSISHPSVTAGTLGCVVYDGSGNRYILSNNHVLANQNNCSVGDATYQPGVYDGGTSSDTVANLSQWGLLYNRSFVVSSANATFGAKYTNNGVTYTIMNTVSGSTTLYTDNLGAPQSSGVLTKTSGTGDATITFSSSVVYSCKADCAISAITNNTLVTDTGYWGGAITQYTNPTLGTVIYKTGRTTGTTYDVVTYVHTSFNVNYDTPLGILKIDDCFATTLLYGTLEGGDSGSCGRVNANTAVGLGFAGGAYLAIFIYMSNVLATLPIISLPYVSLPVKYTDVITTSVLVPTTCVTTSQAVQAGGGSIYDNGSTNTWANPSNAETVGTSYATVGALNGGTTGSHIITQYLLSTGFGFSIPSDAIPLYATASIKLGTSGSADSFFFNMSIQNKVSQTRCNSDESLLPSTTHSFADLNTPILRGGLTFNLCTIPTSDINSSDFGFICDERGIVNGVSAYENVNNINLTVSYVLPLLVTNPTMIGTSSIQGIQSITL